LIQMAKEDQAVRAPAKISDISVTELQVTDDRLTREL
jgi:hypothetical protein